MTDEIPTFEEWCVVELFGHQRYAGRVSQAQWPPGFARLDVPATPGHEAVSQILSPQAIYRLTPTTEEIATAIAASCRPAPVHRYELPAAAAREHEVDPYDEDDVDSNDPDDEPF